jgi:DNA-binding transcriptional regulator YhcF (GntR family)
MEFVQSQSIYMQIADHICERILSGALKEGERISSVRELAEASEVNPNTVMRAYSYLQELGIIRNQRGIGYFVEPEAREKPWSSRNPASSSVSCPRFFGLWTCCR